MVLGTITDSFSANSWISRTFLSVRLGRNPDYYRLDNHSRGLSARAHLERICRAGIKSLQETGLVSGGNKLLPRESGEAMARYYVHFDTMKTFLGLPAKAKISEIVCLFTQVP